MIQLPTRSYEEERLPLCASSVAVKPGSRAFALRIKRWSRSRWKNFPPCEHRRMKTGDFFPVRDSRLIIAYDGMISKAGDASQQLHSGRNCWGSASSSRKTWLRTALGGRKKGARAWSSRQLSDAITSVPADFNARDAFFPLRLECGRGGSGPRLRCALVPREARTYRYRWIAGESAANDSGVRVATIRSARRDAAGWGTARFHWVHARLASFADSNRLEGTTKRGTPEREFCATNWRRTLDNEESVTVRGRSFLVTWCADGRHANGCWSRENYARTIDRLLRNEGSLESGPTVPPQGL